MKSEESEEYKKAVKEIVSQIYDMGGEAVKENDFMFYRFNNPEKFLNWSILNNYLLHGSTRIISNELIPYQANDKIKESGNRLAVYITKVPMVAMFCALTGGVDGLSRRHSSHIKIENGIIDYEEMYFGVSNIKKVTNKGYVYILGKNQVDEEINGEFLSYREVTPMAVIEVKRDDFPYKLDVY